MQLTIYECYREHYVYMCCSFICATDNIPSLEIQGTDPAAEITTALIQLIIHSTKKYTCISLKAIFLSYLYLLWGPDIRFVLCNTTPTSKTGECYM
jgi:hypothetical protein